MANWDIHRITVVGPPTEIARFVRDWGIVHGAIDLSTGRVLDGWDQAPQINLGAGRHIIEKCVVGPCHVDIEFESVRFIWPDAMYRGLARNYPALSFQWCYWLDLGCARGYVDETGDHRYDDNDEVVAVEPGTEGDPVSEDLACDCIADDAAFVRELAQMEAEGDGEAGMASVMVDHAGDTESNENRATAGRPA